MACKVFSITAMWLHQPVAYSFVDGVHDVGCGRILLESDAVDQALQDEPTE